MSFVRAAATVSGLTLVSRICGFVRDVMAAAIVGAGPVADAFFVALRLPNFFRSIAAEGAFSVSFVPLFSKTLTNEGQEVAQEFASQTMAVMLAVLIPFSLVAMFFMPQVLTVLAPGFQNGGGERFHLAVTLTRITFGYLLFMSLASLVGGMLNAIDKFFAFAMAPILFNLMQILLLGIAYYHPSSFPTSGHAMAWGVMSSGVLQLIWLLIVLKKSNVHIRLILPKMTDKIRRLFQLMGPGILGASAVQINLLVDTIIASMLPVGAVSYLYYAQRLDQLPIGLIGTAVGTALLPKLAQKIAAKDHDAANYLFNRALEWTSILTLPAAAALMVIATPITAVLFQRGEFGPHDTIETAKALLAYAIGLPAFVGVKVLSTALYAQENTKTPVKVTLVCATLNIVLCLILTRPYQHAGIAFATAIAGWVQVGMLAHILHNKNDLNFDALFKRNMIRISIATIVMCILLYVFHQLLMTWFDAGHFKALLALVITMAVAGGAYMGLMFVQKVIDVKLIKQSLKGQGI
jgi:putative peptidoglycan lipid II flippase